MDSGQGTMKKNKMAFEWPWMTNPVGATEILMKETVEEIMRRRNGFRDYPPAPTPPPSPAEIEEPKPMRMPNNKTPLHLEDFFKILERTMDHPVVKPEFRYSTYFDHVAAFGGTQLRPYDHLHSAPALCSVPRPRLDIDRSFPSTASRIATSCEEEGKSDAYTHLTPKSHLVTCPQACNSTAQHFHVILHSLKKCGSKAKRIKEGGQDQGHDYGLGQLGGLCKEIYKITQFAIVGTRIFTLAASWGFVTVLDLLRNPKALVRLRKVTVSSGPGLPTEGDCLNARIKIQATLDTIMDSYRKIGRPGFCGNWTDFSRADPEVIGSPDMEQILISLINAFVQLTTLTANLLEVYRTFIFSDNVEKTYLIKHLRSFPPGDQVKVMNNLEVLNGRIRQVHQLLMKLDMVTGRLAKIYAPPDRRGASSENVARRWD